MNVARLSSYVSSIEKYFATKPGTVARVKVVLQCAALILLVVVSSAFSLFMPALFVFLWLMFIAFLPKNPNTTIFVSAINIIFIFGWMNMEKIPTNDWAWYTTHYRWLEEMPLSSYIGNVFNGMTIKSTEPVYHILSALISRISHGSVPVLALVVTAIIYGSVAIGIALLTRGRLKSAFEAVLVTWIPLSVGVTFTLTAQLVRQEIAASLLFLGFTLLWASRRKTGLLFVALAVLTHNSSVFPALCIIFSAWCVIKMQMPVKYWMPLAILFGGAVGGGLILSPSGENYYLSQQNDGAISLAIYLLDSLLIFILFFARKYLTDVKNLTSTMLASLMAYVVLIAAVSPAPLLLLRMYFYMDFFRAAILTLLTIAILKSRHALLLGVPAMLLAFAYIEARLMTSPFYFFGGFTAHLLRPFAFF